MDQPSFAEVELENKMRKTRQEWLLERMARLIPWQRWRKRIERFYP